MRPPHFRWAFEWYIAAEVETIGERGAAGDGQARVEEGAEELKRSTRTGADGTSTHTGASIGAQEGARK